MIKVFTPLFNLSILLVCVLISVAFLTLFERKILSYSQLRKGPNKTAAMGVLQPFSDALKLLFKEPAAFCSKNFMLFAFSPCLSLLVSLVVWFSYPSPFGSVDLTSAVIFIFCCLSVSVYPVLWSGWASNSKFPLLGSLRAVAQTISYEVSFALLTLSLMILKTSYSLNSFYPPGSQWGITLFGPLALIWFTSALAETQRTPFDFAEGESELVSGFNTEFSASPFVMFFLAEYSSVLFMSYLFTVLFLSPSPMGVSNSFKTSLVLFSFIWTRATLPRLRYDKLMHLAWKVFLPFSLAALLFSFCIT